MPWRPSVRHTVGNLFLSAAYTFQHGLTNIRGNGLFNAAATIQDAYHPGNDYGSATFNATHVFSFSTVWNLPWFRGGNGLKRIALGAGNTPISPAFIRVSIWIRHWRSLSGSGHPSELGGRSEPEWPQNCRRVVQHIRVRGASGRILWGCRERYHQGTRADQFRYGPVQRVFID